MAVLHAGAYLLAAQHPRHVLSLLHELIMLLLVKLHIRGQILVLLPALPLLRLQPHHRLCLRTCMTPPSAVV